MSESSLILLSANLVKNSWINIKYRVSHNRELEADPLCSATPVSISIQTISFRVAKSIGLDSNFVLMRAMCPSTSDRIGAKGFGPRKSVNTKELIIMKYDYVVRICID